MAPVLKDTSRYEGLSCYVANLARYLDAELDASALVAASVRLAVRTDLADRQLAFSHHRQSLNSLPNGESLHYAHSQEPARTVSAVRSQLNAHGRVLVVVDTSRLPWSPSLGGMPAPHWLLVEGETDHGFRVVDEFTGLLPAGQQVRYEGVLTEDGLLSAMTMPGRWRPEQQWRNRLAFGVPVRTPPAGEFCWLERRPNSSPVGELAGRWLIGDTAALPYLAEFFATHGAEAAHHLDDVWTVAQHRVFALRRAGGGAADQTQVSSAAETEAIAWSRLPSALKFAVDSARRGRPRTALIRATFDNLLNLRAAGVREPNERTMP